MQYLFPYKLLLLMDLEQFSCHAVDLFDFLANFDDNCFRLNDNFLKGIRTMLDAKTINTDNEHFIGDIVFIRLEPAQEVDHKDYGYTLYLELGCSGNNARAGYNYHPERKQWELGCN